MKLVKRVEDVEAFDHARTSTVSGAATLMGMPDIPRRHAAVHTDGSGW